MMVDNAILVQSKERKELLHKLEELSQFIGETPLFPIRNIFSKPNVEIYAKLEWMQLGGSVKARAAYNIIKTAIEEGRLDRKRRFLDATSGNTGIAYAHICAALDIPITICMPEDATQERKIILKAMNVELVFTPAHLKTSGSQAVAQQIANSNPDLYFLADQYSNEANWKAHYENTAHELVAQTEGRITHFASGLGTTGTFIGTARGLKELNKNIRCVALEPDCADHGLPGWKHLATSKIPSIFDDSVPDQYISIGLPETQEILRQVARKEGLLISPSSAANLAGAIRLANQIEEGVIVTVFPDDASKYSEEVAAIFANAEE
jgi:S-sulfo-L-cysteine synthase (O-acetyl-L-serine-dependent)